MSQSREAEMHRQKASSRAKDVLAAAVVAMICWPALGSSQVTYQGAFVPFEAVTVVQRSQSGEPRGGRFARRSDGSTRDEVWDRNKRASIVTIRNWRLHLKYVKRADGAWAAMALLEEPRVPSRTDFEQPGVILEDTKFRGMDAVVVRVDGQEGEKILLPLLNYFPVRNSLGGHSERLVRIEIREQPDADFIPPKGVAVTPVFSQAELDEFTRGIK
jgi:hypothetical protein